VFTHYNFQQRVAARLGYYWLLFVVMKIEVHLEAFMIWGPVQDADLLEDNQSSSVGRFDIAHFIHIYSRDIMAFIEDLHTFEDHLAQKTKIIEKWCSRSKVY
jgi:hypothetical protein